MTRRVSSLFLCLMILSGCKSSGTGKSGLRLTEGYVPAVPETSLTSASLDRESGVPALAESASAANQNTIQKVSATDADTKLQLTSLSEIVDTSISLQQSIFLALSQNPDLVTLRQTERVSSATLGVAQTYPFNPFLQVQATPWQDAPNGTPPANYHYVLLMQTIQLAHQQQFRELGATFTLNSTRWNIHQAELQNMAQTERLYFISLYQRGLMELNEASDRNNQQLLSILQKQLDAG